MSLGEKIRSGAKWSFFGNTTSQVLTFVFGIVLARLLVPADFGMLVTISVFTGFAGFVAGAGMGQALVRAKEATKQDYDIVFTLQFAELVLDVEKLSVVPGVLAHRLPNNFLLARQRI